MISLICGRCNTKLEVDDAFAGGVCRCQHCGTIQTVPKLTRTGKPSPSAAPKVLYAKSHTPGNTGANLDDLADIVASSGLSRSSLRQAPFAASPPASTSLLPKLLVGAGIVIVLIIAAVLSYLRISHRYKDLHPQNTEVNAVVPAPPPVVRDGTPQPKIDIPAVTVAANPTFLSVPLTGDRIAYVLDRGSSSAEVFTIVLDATRKSVASLKPTQSFQIVFWDVGGGATAFPNDGPLQYIPRVENDLKQFLDSISPFGRSDALPAIQLALRSNPTDVVLVTAKGWEMDAEFSSAVTKLLSSSRVRFHTFSLNAAEASPGLKLLSDQTGGTHLFFSAARLREME